MKNMDYDFRLLLTYLSVSFSPVYKLKSTDHVNSLTRSYRFLPDCDSELGFAGNFEKQDVLIVVCIFFRIQLKLIRAGPVFPLLKIILDCCSHFQLKVKVT